MPVVPLGTGAYRRNDGFVPEVRCVNFMLEPDKSGISPDSVMRVQRPGLSLVREIGSPVRGVDSLVSDGRQIAVGGSNLYIDGALVGGVGSGDLVAMTGTLQRHAVLSGANLYLYDTMLAAVSAPGDAPAFIDIDQLNGYIVIMTQTGRFYWIEPGSNVIDPLNFANAESSGDEGVAVRRLGDELWFFGTQTTEVWQPTGDQDAPFQRVSGRQYERGCLARDTVRRFDNSLMWVGDDGQVYRGGSVPQVVSDSGLAERIRNRTGAMNAFVFGIDGHSFYVLDIPGRGTFAFDALTTEWCEFSTGSVGWLVRSGYQRGGDLFAGARDTGRIYRIDPNAMTDDGTPFERILTGTASLMGRNGRNDSATVGVGCSADCSVRFRWKDGRDDFPDYYDEITARSPIDAVSIYRLGQPQQPYRTFEISVIDPVRVRIAGAKVNEAWQ